MAPSKHLAATVGPAGSVIVKELDVPKPGPGEILVKVVAFAQNPTDWKTAKFVNRVGAVTGTDFSGVVEETGPDVPEGLWKVGDRVAGYVRGGLYPNGAFAEYLVASAQYGVLPVPEGWSFEDAAQLGCAAFTALQTLYQSHNFPTPLNPTTTPITLLVSGGASSVGQWVVQFAKQAGLYVIATASAKNFDLVKSLGADEVFDYKEPDAGAKIKASTKGELKYVIDTISEESSAKVVFDALGDEGGVIAALLKYPTPPRDNIKVVNSAAFDMLGKDYEIPMKHVSTPAVKERSVRFGKLLSDVLATGKVKPNPVLLLPNGLAGVQNGYQYMADGKVSAQKITYRIADTPRA